MSYDFLKIWPWKSKVKVIGEVTIQSHNVGLESYRLTSLSALPFLRKSIFKIWPWKSRVKFMGEVTVQSHNVGVTSYRLTSLLFYVNRPSHSWDTAFSKFGLENANKKEQGKSEGFESCDRPIVRKRPIRVKSGDVLSRVTLKFDGWLWKTIGHLFYATSSFVHHFVAIGEFKLQLQSGNAQSGSNSTILRAVRP